MTRSPPQHPATQVQPARDAEHSYGCLRIRRLAFETEDHTKAAGQMRHDKPSDHCQAPPVPKPIPRQPFPDGRGETNRLFGESGPVLEVSGSVAFLFLWYVPRKAAYSYAGK